MPLHLATSWAIFLPIFVLGVSTVSTASSALSGVEILLDFSKSLFSAKQSLGTGKTVPGLSFKTADVAFSVAELFLTALKGDGALDSLSIKTVKGCFSFLQNMQFHLQLTLRWHSWVGLALKP